MKDIIINKNEDGSNLIALVENEFLLFSIFAIKN